MSKKKPTPPDCSRTKGIDYAKIDAYYKGASKEFFEDARSPELAKYDKILMNWRENKNGPPIFEEEHLDWTIIHDLAGKISIYRDGQTLREKYKVEMVYP